MGLEGCVPNVNQTEGQGDLETESFLAGDTDTDQEGGCIGIDAGAVVFSEIMFHPQASSTNTGQFIELYNTSSDILFMEGWTLSDGEQNATSLALPPEHDFPPYSYVLLGFDADTETNGGLSLDLVIDNIDLSTKHLRIFAGNTLIDELNFSGLGFPDVRGSSMNLAPSRLDATLNDQAVNWCASYQLYGMGDLGTPGIVNLECVDAPVCGDETIDDPEQCDDAQNTDDLDGCKYNCRFSCADPDADCGNTLGDCQRPVCVTSSYGQQCADIADHTDLPDDSNACTENLCLEGAPSHPKKTDGTSCNNQTGLDGDYCKQGLCIEPVCGDSVRGPLEECDDGGHTDGDGCSANCLWEECGNNRIDYGEDCDDGKDGDSADGCTDACLFTCSNANADCSNPDGDCHAPACIENDVGKVCSQVVAQSDVPLDGNPCTFDLCDASGNASNPWVSNGTSCDNASGVVGDYCVQAVCIDPICNDGILGPLEACDDGNQNPCDGCLPECTLYANTCGDTYACPPEECDDGNNVDGDGCSAMCALESNVCPDDMVAMPCDPALSVYEAFCMDRYEASRPDATADSQGTETTTAVSQANVIPWHTSYMNTTVYYQYQTACQNAGKRLCSEEEWYLACAGPLQQTYVFGNTFDRETCNCVDTFCDDFCNAHPEITNCDIGYNCGYTYDPYSFHVVPTGTFAECVNPAGAYDVCGNVWEIVPSSDNANGKIYEVRGGAFNCSYADIRLQCTYNASWNELYAGFRCCKDLD